MQDILMDVLSYLVYSSVIAFISVLIHIVKKVSCAWIESIEIKIDNQAVQTALTEITEFTRDAVIYVAQTYVDNLLHQ